MYNTIDGLDPVRWTPTRSRQPAFAGLRDWLARQRAQLASAATPSDDLVELDAHTRANIGAPDHLLERAMARREVQRQEREDLRIGLAPGAWQHW